MTVEWGVLYEDGVERFGSEEEQARQHAAAAPVPIALVVSTFAGEPWVLTPERSADGDEAA